MHYKRSYLKGLTLIPALLAILAGIFLFGGVSQARAQEGESIAACAITPDIFDGQSRFSVIGAQSRFSVIGAQSRFSVIGAQGGTPTDAELQALLDEIAANTITPDWVLEFLGLITEGGELGLEKTAILIVDHFDNITPGLEHGELVSEVVALYAALGDFADYFGVAPPFVQVFPVNIGGANGYNVDAIAGAIGAQVEALRAQGFENFVVNMSFGVIPCEYEDFNFYDFLNWQQMPGGITLTACKAPATGPNWRAKFSYSNANTSTVNIPGGPNNFSLKNGVAFGTPPTSFLPGGQDNVFEIIFPNAQSATWTVTTPSGTSSVTVTSSTPNCSGNSPRVIPILECVEEIGEDVYRAHWGYENRDTSNVEISVGGKNKFQPNPQGRGQPTTFQPGRHYNVFTTDFNGGDLTWHVERPGSNTPDTATASSESIDCADVSLGLNNSIIKYLCVVLNICGEAEVHAFLQGLFGSLNDDQLADLRNILQHYLNESAEYNGFSFIPFASSGNYADILGTPPLSPANMNQTIAISALLGQGPGSLWPFSQHGNIAAPGAWFEFNQGGEPLYAAGTSFAAPGASFLAAIQLASGHQCNFGPGPAGVVPLTFHPASNFINALFNLSPWPLDCFPPEQNTDPDAQNDSANNTYLAYVDIDVLANDSDTDGDTLSVFSFTQGTHGSVALNLDGTLRYTHTGTLGLNQTVTDTFEYTASDGNGGTDTATVTVVTARLRLTSDCPRGVFRITNPASFAIDYTWDTAGGPDSGSGTAAPGSNPAAIIVPANSTVRLFVGSQQHDVKATINNCPPEANNDAYNVYVGQSVTFNVLDNDTDPDGNPLSVTGTSNGPFNGTLQDNGGGSFTYTPNSGYTGGDSFDYAITDGISPNTGNDSAAVSITVLPVYLGLTSDCPKGNYTVTSSYGFAINFTWQVVDGPSGNDSVAANGSTSFNTGVTSGTVQVRVGGFLAASVNTVANCPPVAEDDAAATIAGSPVTVDVLANDSDPDGDTLTVTGNTDPANGSVVDNGDGTFTYTPNNGFTGDDTFTYTISDGNGGTDTATVTITVNSVALQLTAICPKGKFRVSNANAFDVNFTWEQVGGGASGGGSVSANGTTTFHSGLLSGTVRILVGGVEADTEDVIDNCPPDAVDDSVNTPFNTAVNFSVLGNDSDPDPGDSISLDSFTSPASGTLAHNGGGNFDFTPAAGFSGQVTFTYTIKDVAGATDTATVTITVGDAGSLRVTKNIEWGGADPFAVSFTICITGPSYPVQNCQNTGGGVLPTWINLIPGQYQVFEINTPQYWTASGPVNVQVAAGQLAYASILNTYDAPPPPPPVCDDPNPGRDLTGYLEISGSHAYGYVTNNSDACEYTVGIASYRKFDEIIDNQELFHGYDGVVVPPGETVSSQQLNVRLPDCAAQVDLFWGELLLHLNGQRYGVRLLDARHVNQSLGYCQRDEQR